jgi:hypothetical protein
MGRNPSDDPQCLRPMSHLPIIGGEAIRPVRMPLLDRYERPIL